MAFVLPLFLNGLFASLCAVSFATYLYTTDTLKNWRGHAVFLLILCAALLTSYFTFFSKHVLIQCSASGALSVLYYGLMLKVQKARAYSVFRAMVVADVLIACGFLLERTQAPVSFQVIPGVVISLSFWLIAIGVCIKTNQVSWFYLHTRNFYACVAALLYNAIIPACSIYFLLIAILGRGTASIHSTPLLCGLVLLLCFGTLSLFSDSLQRILPLKMSTTIGIILVFLSLNLLYAAMYTLLTHIFFTTSLTFLTNNVAFSMSGEQDLRKIGGIQRKIPVTYALSVTTVICLLAACAMLCVISEEFFAGLRGGIVLSIYIVFFVFNAVYYLRFVFATFKEESHSGEHVSAYIKESNMRKQIPIILCLIMGCGATCFLCVKKEGIMLATEITGLPGAVYSFLGAFLLFCIFCLLSEDYLKKSKIIRTYTRLKILYKKTVRNIAKPKAWLLWLILQLYGQKRSKPRLARADWAVGGNGYGAYVGTLIFPRLYKIETLFSADIHDNIKTLFGLLIAGLFIACFIK
ncbi:MAG: hypothetical protein LBF84_01965 [Holosporales bacterium]|jgi:NADH:ubiquinone oxidoreductase subunit 5 (subunit L)/multisubunit Na+/H+ antiporter MnhA subunit|nr:hypothetical protein [Holosporales bacterium]